MTDTDLLALLKRLTILPHETEWVEFKHNYADPQDIGEYISALANAAALHERPCGYIVWGIEDQTHRVAGTTFKPRATRVGNQELESWLALQLEPRIDVLMHEFECEGMPMALFEIPRATVQPVRFRGEEYIRSGSYKKKLKEFPTKEKKLWQLFDRTPFERRIAMENVPVEEVLGLLDYPAYFDLTHQPLPENRTGIIEKLTSEKFIRIKDNGRYDITNLGAILFAKNLNAFERLARKAIRVVIYRGNNRVETIREQTGVKGYAVGFEGAIAFINTLLPQNEVIEQALRKEVRMFPEVAIRELVANAVIHQDFSLTGTGPMVEIFSDRMEITNPGTPLIDPLRFMDEPPQSRNEALAAFLRRLHICEERGSGIDKVVAAVEIYQLPAPDFAVTSNHTKAVLYAYREFSEMDKSDRIRACYQHACLRYISNDFMTNTSLRDRFSIDKKNYSMASRVIADAIDKGLVRRYEEAGASKRLAKYVPFWA